MNEWKATKCMCMSNVSAFLSKPERTYWSLTSQLDTDFIEESSVKLLAKPERLSMQSIQGPNSSYYEQDFTMHKLAFAKNKNFF